MVRIEAYPAMGGMLLTVASVCLGERHAGGPCQKEVAVTLVSTERIERFGLDEALVDAVSQLFHEHPDMAELILH